MLPGTVTHCSRRVSRQLPAASDGDSSRDRRTHESSRSVAAAWLVWTWCWAEAERHLREVHRSPQCGPTRAVRKPKRDHCILLSRSILLLDGRNCRSDDRLPEGRFAWEVAAGLRQGGAEPVERSLASAKRRSPGQSRLEEPNLTLGMRSRARGGRDLSSGAGDLARFGQRNGAVRQPLVGLRRRPLQLWGSGGPATTKGVSVHSSSRFLSQASIRSCTVERVAPSPRG